jgi:pSer/pThr/pTyr-binding forkhead associated (FHA) protein
MKLRLFGPDETVRETFLRSEPTWLGRDTDNDVVLRDSTVSRHHCKVFLDDQGSIWIEDAGSRYGTSLNGERIQGRTQVVPGDRLEIGDWRAAVFDELLDDEPVSQEAPTEPQQAEALPKSEVVLRLTPTREMRTVGRSAADPGNTYYYLLLAGLAVAAALTILILVFKS